MQRISTKKEKTMKSESFVFRGEWMNIISDLPDDIRLEVYDAVIRYGISGETIELKPMAKIAFGFMRMAIDKDKEAYSRRSEAGSRGGRPRKDETNENQTKPKKTNENQEEPMVDDGFDCLCDNDNVNDNVIIEKVSKETKKKFSPPTIEEVDALCKERGYTATNPSAFVAYYESNGWRVGKNPMKSWESALAGWEVREKERGKAAKPTEIGRTKFSHHYDKPW
jgi:hypothetical protein